MLNGIIVINKPKGCTSHDVVNKVKKILNTKIGHTGTLDPNATGVLPLLVGSGTKLSYYLTEHNKEYIATLQLGIKTDTADGEGKVIEEKVVIEETLEKEIIEEVLKTFIGKQQQIPPIYSAIKVNGKKLYEYARKDEDVEIKPREIQIYDISLIDILRPQKQVVFKVKCSKGTYIRSLCESVAEKMKTVGYMKELQRTVVGEFNIENSITVEELENKKDDVDFMKNHFITIEKFFEKKEENSKDIILDERKLQFFLNGVKLTYDLPDGLYRIYKQYQNFVGIGLVKNNCLKREIIVENENKV